jgi:hypothetical protein
VKIVGDNQLFLHLWESNLKIDLKIPDTLDNSHKTKIVFEKNWIGSYNCMKKLEQLIFKKNWEPPNTNLHPHLSYWT